MKVQENLLKKFTISNGIIKATILNYGATLLELFVPNQNNNPYDVILGYETLTDYFDNPPCFGCCILPSANRIENASFCIDNQQFLLEQNDGSNNLHSGFEPIHKRIWNLKEKNDDSITFEIDVKDMDGGFPGNRHFEINYKILDKSLEISYSCISDKKTVFNPTNHSYFNLNGHASGTILNHNLTIYSDSITYSNSQNICTGEIINVINTPWNFKSPTKIGNNIYSNNNDMKLKKGFDHNYILNSNHAATLTSDKTSITLDIYTTMPGIQLYTGNYLSNTDIGKGMFKYSPYYGVALETQFFPNCVNINSFEKPYILPNEKMTHKTSYCFS